LCYLRTIVVVVEANQKVASAHLLKVGYIDFSNDAGNLRAQGRKVAADVSIICYLLDSPTLP
jgi:hypothetical protein